MEHKKKHIHFIGAGGIGMSALAQWFIYKGWHVTGSDEADSGIVRMLRKKGMRISIGRHKAKNVPKRIDRIVYSQAIIVKGRNLNPEIQAAKIRHALIQSYPEALGELTKEKYTIAICGTHGKSTTTGLVGVLLTYAGLDPTVIVGATVPEFNNSNFRHGDSRFLVIEADEYKGAFLHYSLDIVLWTSVEWEHVDYFKTYKQMLSYFKRFLSHVSQKGYVIANGDNKDIRRIISSQKKIRHRKLYSLKDGKTAKRIQKNMKLIGEHNVSNAMGAYMVSEMLGVPDHIFWKTLKRFTGVRRRMEYKGKLNGAMVYDDYGHHPTEIKTTLAGVRKKFEKRLRRGKLWCVYQPHQYQRTKYLFHDFARAFADADGVLLLDIYSVAGREKESLKKEVNSQKLASAVIRQKTPAFYMPAFIEAVKFLKQTVRKNDVVVIMGAGDIWKIWKYLRVNK